MIYKGSCHCGQIAFEAEGNLEKVIECNCSICSKHGSLHWFIPRESFSLLTPEDGMSTYTFNQHTIKHRSCPKCGCAPYSEGIAPSGNYMVAINARCLTLPRKTYPLLKCFNTSKENRNDEDDKGTLHT